MKGKLRVVKEEANEWVVDHQGFGFSPTYWGRRAEIELPQSYGNRRSISEISLNSGLVHILEPLSKMGFGHLTINFAPGL